jgi:hypothetical protein
MPGTWNGAIPSTFEHPLGFSVEVLAVALTMAIFVDAMQNTSSRECWNYIVVHLEGRRDTFVNDCGVGLTMVAVVVVEM